jgi:hypothetical protein
MTPEQKAAYVMAQAAAALIEAMGMMASNMVRQQRGAPPQHWDDEFRNLVDKYGLRHNQVLSLFAEP